MDMLPLHHQRPSRSRRASGAGDSLFAWTIIILLLAGLALATWIGSYYVFGHPEKPLSYALLIRLKKLDPPKRFELTAAPRGEFLGPQALLDRFGKMTPREMRRVSDGLMRDYLRNYRLAPSPVPYVVGDYAILDSYELTPANFFPSGVVVLAQAKDQPQVVLEHIFPAEPKVVPVLQRMLLTGLDLQLKRSLDMSAVVHVQRLADGRLQITAVPLLYGRYASTEADGTFSLQPPAALNVAAGLPVLDPKTVAEATTKYAEFRRRAGLPGLPPRPAPQLVRVERPALASEDASKPPPPPEDTPPPATPAPVLAAADIPAPTPATLSTPPPPTPAPEPTPSPAPTPGAVVAAAAGGSWPVYEPGRMPRGRLLNLRDMPHLAAQGTGGERMYLQGSFVVTASGGNRAVLRAQGALTEALGFRGRASNVRVIAEFPPGTTPPSEGSTFSRDSLRPFQIMDVRTGADGQINVFVREVTR